MCYHLLDSHQSSIPNSKVASNWYLPNTCRTFRNPPERSGLPSPPQDLCWLEKPQYGSHITLTSQNQKVLGISKASQQRCSQAIWDSRDLHGFGLQPPFNKGIRKLKEKHIRKTRKVRMVIEPAAFLTTSFAANQTKTYLWAVAISPKLVCKFLPSFRLQLNPHYTTLSM